MESTTTRDGIGAAFPVSVKGVVVRGGRVLLLRNERDEWELPGGRLEVGETPSVCVEREIAEETGWRVRSGPLLDAWVYRPAHRDVLVVAYGCRLLPGQESLDPVLSSEHGAVGLFDRDEVDGLPLPDGYRISIARWFSELPTVDSSGADGAEEPAQPGAPVEGDADDVTVR